MNSQTVVFNGITFLVENVSMERRGGGEIVVTLKLVGNALAPKTSAVRGVAFSQEAVKAVEDCVRRKFGELT